MSDITLHLGGHKTATTYLQNMIDTNKKILREKGFVSPPLVPFRRHYPGHSFDETMQTIQRTKNQWGKCRELMISDENLIGELFHICKGKGFFPETREKLDYLKDWLPQEPAKIFFAIRNYDDFFPSAFAQWISPAQFEAITDKTREIFLSYERGWVDVIRDIHSVFPNVELVLWQYEDFGEIEEKLVESLTGVAFAELETDPGKRSNPTLSWEAYKIIEFASLQGLKTENLRPFLKRHPIENATPIKSKIWIDGDAEFFDEKYSNDISTIISEFGDKFIK